MQHIKCRLAGDERGKGSIKASHSAILLLVLRFSDSMRPEVEIRAGGSFLRLQWTRDAEGEEMNLQFGDEEVNLGEN